MRNRIYIFIVLFSISIVIRLPFLNRPLAGHFEWLTAHTALTLKIWEKEGIYNHHFAPIYSWKDEENFPIGNLGTVKDKNGRMYYISYPPAGFWFPYGVGRILHIPMSVLWIQIWNVFIHAISAWLLSDIIFLWLGFQAWIWSLLWYLFLPTLLWFFGNVYFIDMQAQGLFIAWLWAVYRFEKNQKKIYFVWISLFLLALCLTEWIGLFAGFSWFCLDFYKNRKINYKILICVGLCSILSLGIIFYLYTSISGSDAFMEAALSKFLARSGSQSATHTRWEFRSYFYLLAHYFLAYWQLIACVALAGIIVISRPNFKFLEKKEFSFLIFTSLAPVFIHHFVFFNFAAGHFDFPTIKAAPAFVIISAWIYAQMLRELCNVSFKRRIVIQSLFYCILIISIPIYWLRNTSESQHLLKNMLFISKHTINHEFQELGLKIKKETHVYEIPAILGSDIINPQIVWYAERNIVAGTNMDSILSRTVKNNTIRVFRIDETWTCDSVFTISNR